MSVVEGRSTSGDSITRNLLPDLDEEAKDGASDAGSEDVDLSGDIAELNVGDDATAPATPITRAVNSVPVKMDPTRPTAVPARMIEVIMSKHDGLKHLQVTRVSAAADVRDPGFASMKTQQQVLHGIIGVFNTAGYSVTILDNAKILATRRDKLIAGAQAIFELFLRHQSQRKLEQAIGANRGGLMDAESLQKIAEQVIGRSREEVKQMEEEIMLKDKMLKDLENYLQDFADRVASGELTAAQLASVSTAAAPTVASAEAKPTVKPEPKVKAEKPTPVAKSPAAWSSTDYLADIYDECVAPGVSAMTRLRQSACADLKSFDGKSRDEYRGKAFISSVRSAFRQDEMTDGQCCLKFPELLTGASKIWYKQLKKSTRANWSLLQAEFEREYCGATVTAHQRYYELRRKPNEEHLDYLYRLNVKAIEAGIDYEGAAASFHVTHFLDTCEDAELARQFGLAKPTTEEQLRQALKELLRQNQRSRRDESAKLRADKRDSKPKPFIAGSKQRPIAVNALAKLLGSSSRAAEVDLSSVSESSSDGSESEDSGAEDGEGDEGEDAAEAAGLATMLAPESVQALTKLVAALQGRDRVGKPKGEVSKPQHPCSHCGSKRHQDRDCWSRITCTVCGRLGHPADYCYHRCKGCGNVHDRGACPLEELANHLKAWFDPTKHAGVLPAAVEKWLN